MKRPSRRAFILALSLLLCVLLLVLGVGFLGKRAAQSAAANSEGLSAAARALAEAGLEDARVKLDKDMFFPPPADEDQKFFSYGEKMTDVAGTTVGFYFVDLDLQFATAPDPPDPSHSSVIRVTSIGSVGEDPNAPRAMVTLRMEVDVDEGRAGPPPEPPTRPFRIIDWVDEVLPDL